MSAVPLAKSLEAPLVGSATEAPTLACSAGNDTIDWLTRLNPAQRRAASFGACMPSSGVLSAPLLVIAGAGTGKTATLAHRVAWLVLNGVDPERILLLTFSRRSAQEMTRRAERLVAEVSQRTRAAIATGRGSVSALNAAGAPPVKLAWSGTFHAVGARLIRQHAMRLGLDERFGILDRGDAADLIDVVRQEHGLSEKSRRFPRKDACLAIYSYRINTGWPLERVLAEVWPWCAQWQDDLRLLFRAYVECKLAQGVLDYDDLLLWWHSAMSDPALAAQIGAGFDHVLVDEFQDTNTLQGEILLRLKPDGAGVTVVGDDAQSIYSFRAANVGNILEFPARFEPPAARITLDCNYRSVQPVLDCANALIAQAKRQYPKTLSAQRGPGARPRLVTVLDERAQADFVIDEVLVRREAGVPLRRQAVLFRSGHHSDALEVELARRNIPFVKYGGLKFLEAHHIKDVLAVLRWADNPRNGVAGFRALQLLDGIGPATARRCLDQLAEAGNRLDALDGFNAPDASGEAWPSFVALMAGLAPPEVPWAGQLERVTRWYRPLLESRHDDALVRAADLEMLAALAPQFASRERFLTELTLDPPSASGDLAGDPYRDEDYLILSTVHSAKGQEWDSVYVLNVTDGNFPNEFSTGTEAGLEEERRLLYVAMTRARDRLDLIEPQRYFVTQQPRYGDRYVHGARSRFLAGAVLDSLEVIGLPGGSVPGRVGRPDGGHGGVPTGGLDGGGRILAPVVDVAQRLRGMW